jgi:hypothetical protein
LMIDSNDIFKNLFNNILTLWKDHLHSQIKTNLKHQKN